MTSLSILHSSSSAPQTPLTIPRWPTSVWRQRIWRIAKSAPKSVSSSSISPLQILSPFLFLLSSFLFSLLQLLPSLLNFFRISCRKEQKAMPFLLTLLLRGLQFPHTVPSSLLSRSKCGDETSHEKRKYCWEVT